MATKFGTLVTNVSHRNDEYNAGCRRAMLEFKWQYYETSEGVYNTTYINNYVNSMNQLKAAGFELVLSLGIHFIPSWVKANSSVGTYVNQNGTASNAANIVFSADVRSKLNAYLSQVHADFNLNNFSQIRITSGGNSAGELLYPQEGGYSYWAFDSAALTGTGLASGQTPNPFPSWKPGSSDTSITTAQVNTWATWYVTSLANCAKYLMDQLNSLGFTGSYALLMPGSGIRPSGFTSAVNGYLPSGNIMGVGAAWYLIAQTLSTLPYKSRVGIHCSSVGDGSGGDDYTLPSDITTYGGNVSSTAMNSWSASRWLTFLSNVYGFRMGGENTGYSGQSKYKDTTTAGMMNKAMAQVKNGNWEWFDWAHSDHLYDKVQYLANYKSVINTVNGPKAPTTYYLSNSGQWTRNGK